MVTQDEIEKYLPVPSPYPTVNSLTRTILDTFLSELALGLSYFDAAQVTETKLAPFGVNRNKLLGATSVWREKNNVHYLFRPKTINRPKKDSTLVKQELLVVARLFYGNSDMTWDELKIRLGVVTDK